MSVDYITCKDPEYSLNGCNDELPPSLPLHTLHSRLVIAMPLRGSEIFCKESPPLQIDFVHVAGQYRVGKLLGSGGSGESNSDSSPMLL